MPDIENPFLEDSVDLISLETSQIMPTDVVKSVMTAKDNGRKLCEHFFSERIMTRNVARSSPLNLNKLTLFSTKPHQCRKKSEIASLKEERTQVIQIMLSGQAGREINEEVFAHENCDCPPSLTSQGQMHKGTKSELIKCLESEVPAVYTSPKVDVAILDGAFIVQSLRPGTTSTFEEYADHLFIPYILSCLSDVSRLDIVWDSYKTDSIKYGTRKKRGSSIHQRVTLAGKIPTNWQGFLRVDANKEELFELIA